MADNNIYKVRSNSLQHRLYNDMEKGRFTDVNFKIGPEGNQRTFQAHRLVLASESSEFEKLINRSDDSQAIQIPDVLPKAFENLIMYFYGRNFIFKDLISIHETGLTAMKFKVLGLMLSTENHLIDLIKSESLIEVLSVCFELKLPRAKERCLEAISPRLEAVLKTEELLSVSLEVMEAILGLCANRESDLKLSAIYTLLIWAERHKCPDIVLQRLYSMIECKDISPDVTLLDLKEAVQSIKSNIRVEDEILSSIKNSFLERVKVDGKTAFKDSPTKTSEEGKKTLLEDEKVFTNKTDESELKDKREIDVEAEKTPDVDEKKSNADVYSEDLNVVEQQVIKDIIKESSELITLNVESSSQETVERLIAVVGELTDHAAESMQIAIDDMEDHFKYLTPCSVHTPENKEVPSS